MPHYPASPKFSPCRKDELNKEIPGRPVASLLTCLGLLLQYYSTVWNGYYCSFQSHSRSYFQSVSISSGFPQRAFFVEYLTIPRAPLNPINQIARKVFAKVPNRENFAALSSGPLLIQGEFWISVFSSILFTGCCNIPSWQQVK